MSLSVFIPLLLLIMAFILRLVVLRNPDKTELIEAFCEIPVDLVFLSLSFLMAYTISEDEHHTIGMGSLMTGIVIAMIVATLRRLSINGITSKKENWHHFFVSNLLIGGACLILSIMLLNGTFDEPSKSDDGSKTEIIKE